jgi:hypothetical protein
MSDVAAETFPSSPKSVGSFVASFLTTTKDDVAVRRTCVTQQSISLGSWDIRKFSGTCDVRWRRNRLVRMSLGGLSKARG